MKKLIALLMLCLFVGGCTEFLVGVGTGLTAAEQLAQDAQVGLIESVNALNVEKAKYDTLIAKVQDSSVKEALEALINDETRVTLEGLRATDWKDPKVVSGYALALAGLLTAGYQKKKRTDEK